MRVTDATIALWQRLPLEADEEPGMPTYRVAGTVLIGNRQRAYCIDISCEIDGRDCEFQQTTSNDFRATANGCSQSNAPDIGEVVFELLCEREDWVADFNKQAEEYYAAG